MKRFAVFNSNALKLIAAAAMLIDHAGLILFSAESKPYLLMRIIGRISFPVFAFMIAEGCKHTKNKKKHFLCIFGFGVISQALFQTATGAEYLGILLTFSVSVLMIYVLLACKRHVCCGDGKDRIIFVFIFSLLVLFAVLLSKIIQFDYGITGVLLPVALTLPSFAASGKSADTAISRLIDSNFTRCIIVAIAVISLALSSKNNVYFYSLMSLPFLLLYSGKRGKLNLKWFFYIFYPAHLIILTAIGIILTI